MAHGLVLEPLRRSRPGRDRSHDLADQRLARLIRTDLRALLVEGPAIHLQHVFHRARERGAGFRRDAPRPLPPRLEFVFGSACRTASGQLESTTFNSTGSSASLSGVQATRPRGAFEPARAIGRASPAPSRAPGGARPAPCGPGRFQPRPDEPVPRTRSTVAALASRASAMCSSIQPGPPSAGSACNGMRARANTRADAFPLPSRGSGTVWSFRA